MPLAYPPARRSTHVDVYFNTSIADPYRWMEDLDSPELEAWVAAENTLTQSLLREAPARDAIHARLMELSDYERFSLPERERARLFYTRNSGLQNQPVLYWQQGEAGEGQMLLDPNTLAGDATVALNSYAASDDGELLAYALSEAGSDVQTIRLKRVATGEDLPDRIDWVKFSGIGWARDGLGFYYGSFGPPPAADSGPESDVLKRRTAFHRLYFHTLGTPQSEDRVVYERPDDGELLVSGGPTEDGRWLVLSAGKGHTNTLAVRDLRQPEAPPISLAPTDDAIYGVLGNVGDEMWMQTNKDAPNSRIVKVDLRRPEPANWQTIVAEREQSLESAVMVGGTLLLSYLVDAQSRVEQRALDGSLVREIALPGIGLASVAGGRADDRDTFFVFTNYTTPGTVHRLELTTGATEVWRRPRLQFDPAAYETTLVFAASKDGTRVPLFLTGKRGLPRDGSVRTLLYGYGGFNISLGPAYSSSRLAWIESGGLYAEAILRGGGEYGEAWHQAGTKTQKQNTFDDFIACAELLLGIASPCAPSIPASSEWVGLPVHYTSPAKLAIQGGSNGGLLVAAVALQRPELFGAVLAQVGVLDMLRFDQFTIGYAWKPDYGSPSDNEEEFRAILRYSPLHNIGAGTRYPAFLILTADHDDRVFPAHSFKFAAALQAAMSETPDAAPVLIRVETRAGHGAGMPLSKQLDVTADMYAFLSLVLA